VPYQPQLNLHSYIDQSDYLKEDYEKTKELPDGTSHINYYTDDAYDWDKLNKDIDKYKNEGLVVVGMALVEDKIDHKSDYHIHLSIPKKMCMARRRQYIENNKEKYKKDFEYIDTPTESLKMNQMIFPYYLETKQRSKISKFINGVDMNKEQIFDAAWDMIIEYIQSNIESIYLKWIKDHPDAENEKNKKEEGTMKEELTPISDSDTESKVLESSDDMSTSDVKDGPIAFIPIKPEVEEEDVKYTRNLKQIR
jgi:hypothetical protein